jgi:hypothetical protein
VSGPPLRLISTDFDGTLFAEFESPPIPEVLQALLGRLQAGGAKWVINTGRDMSSLMEALGRAQISVEPDFLVLVEREIYAHHDSQYVGLEEWNRSCVRSHAEVFARIAPDIPRLVDWINTRFHARIYEDAYSPLCLITSTNGDMDAILGYLSDYCRRVPGLAIVRNDVYARFCHADFNKGTALAELTRRLGLTSRQVFAAGDHLNDLPMLSTNYAACLGAPANAVEPVKQAVAGQGGHVSPHSHGTGVADALEHFLAAGRQAGE